MRSAERGPTPGICRSCATKSRSAAGYSVFLNAPYLPVLHRQFREIERERFETTDIQLQRHIFFVVRTARFLKFRIGFGPAFLSIEHNPVPETIAPRELFRLGFGCGPERFVNLMTLARIHAAEEIDRPRNHISTRQFKRSRSNQNFRTIETVRHAKTTRELDRFAARDEARTLAILKRRDNHRAGANADMHVAFSVVLGETRLAKLVDHVER